mmetsp:Transcript_26138/g.30194  ORF Transcript_26138/g.30194 Transcript_26138/m.30194 type:complete len:95 (-) Transcript_26138:117-401(-)
MCNYLKAYNALPTVTTSSLSLFSMNNKLTLENLAAFDLESLEEPSAVSEIDEIEELSALSPANSAVLTGCVKAAAGPRLVAPAARAVPRSNLDV